MRVSVLGEGAQPRFFPSVERALGLDGISAGHKPASRHKGGFDLQTVSTVSACSSDAMARQFVL